MKLIAILAAGLVLLFSPVDLLAQHGGHRGGGSQGGAPRSGTVDPTDASLTDFNHALTVQATSDQISHFPELTQSTETARKLAQSLSEGGAKADNLTGFARKAAALKDAVEEAQGSNQDFMKSFTKSQKSGLKELAKKLVKAESEVVKQWKGLESQMAESKTGGEAVAGAAGRLEKALEDLQTQQIELGKEMGLQTPTV